MLLNYWFSRPHPLAIWSFCSNTHDTREFKGWKLTVYNMPTYLICAMENLQVSMLRLLMSQRPRRDRWMLMPQVLLQKARLPRNSILRISYRICIIQEGKASLLKPNQKRKTHRYCHNWTNQGYPSINTFRFLVPSLQIASTLFSGGVSF